MHAVTDDADSLDALRSLLRLGPDERRVCVFFRSVRLCQMPKSQPLEAAGQLRVLNCGHSHERSSPITHGRYFCPRRIDDARGTSGAATWLTWNSCTDHRRGRLRRWRRVCASRERRSLCGIEEVFASARLRGTTAFPSGKKSCMALAVMGGPMFMTDAPCYDPSEDCTQDFWQQSSTILQKEGMRFPASWNGD